MNKWIIATLICCIQSVAFAQIPADAKFGGNCALSMATEGKKVPTDCKIAWKEPNGAGTYCFGSAESLATWSKDPITNLQKAEMMNAKNLQNEAISNANVMMDNSKAMMDQAMKQMEKAKMPK